MSIGIRPDAERIDELRMRCVFTWGELAERAGISKPTKTALRQGRRVSVRTIRAVARALGVEASTVVRVESARAEAAVGAT